MTVKDSHFIRILIHVVIHIIFWYNQANKVSTTLSPNVFILVYIYLSSQTGKAFNSIFSLQSQSEYFYIFLKSFHHLYRNAFRLLFLSLTLNVLTYPLNLGNISIINILTLISILVL